MTNHQSQTNRSFGPACTSDVLPPVQRYAPACRAEALGEGRTCRAETPARSESRVPASSQNAAILNTDPSSEVHLAQEEHAGPLEPSDHQPSTLNHQPIPRSSSPKAHRGKIARLPYAVRDMVNRMLCNNIPHSKIVGALDEHNIKVTERNVSNWKTRGGYRDWCIAQDRALETRLLQDNLTEHLRTNDATQLSEVGLQLSATQLSQFFFKPDVREQITADPEKFSPAINVLCRLTRQLHRLQKYRDDCSKELGSQHDPARIKRQTEETLESTRNVYSSFIPENAPIDPDVPHRNFIPKNGFPL